MKTPRAAVIIAAKNAASTIKKCVDSVLALDFDSYEVIIVNDGSTDDTASLLKGYGDKIRIVASSKKGPSAARNTAAAATKSEYIAFTDSDCIVDRMWLKELMAPFAESQVMSVGGRQEVPDDDTNFGKKVFAFMKAAGLVTEYVRADKRGIKPVDHNASCNVAYRRETYLKTGGFLEGFWPGEDVEFDYRMKALKYRIMFNPAAVVYHYKPRDFKAFTKMMYRYGLAQGILVRKYGVFRKSQALPFLALISTVIFLTVCFMGFFTQALLAALIGTVVLFVVFKFDPVMLGMFISAAFLWNAGFFRGMMLEIGK